MVDIPTIDECTVLIMQCNVVFNQYRTYFCVDDSGEVSAENNSITNNAYTVPQQGQYHNCIVLNIIQMH